MLMLGSIITLAVCSPASAQHKPKAKPHSTSADTSAAGAASQFSLDLPASEDPPPPVSLTTPSSDAAAPDADASSASTPDAAPSDAPAADNAAAPDATATMPDTMPDTAHDATPTISLAPATPFSLDTPIADLIADPRAKAVLDKSLPGLSDDRNLPRFQSMSLRKFQPLTGGQLTDTLLASTGAELAAIPPGDGPRRQDRQIGR